MSGEPSLFYPVETEVLDVTRDPTLTYADPVVIQVLLDEYPSIRLLKGLGWFVDDPATLPIIGYLPYYYLDGQGQSQPLPVRERAVVKFAYESQDAAVARNFQITKVSGSGLRNHWWVVQLAPVRDVFTPAVGADENYVFLDVPDLEDGVVVTPPEEPAP